MHTKAAPGTPRPGTTTNPGEPGHRTSAEKSRESRAGKPSRLPLRLLIPVLALLLCASCAPKEIGSDSVDVDQQYYGKGGPDPMSDARYPIPGVATRKDYYFYRLNQPAVFEAVQEWRMRQFTRGLRGIDPEDPAYREVPKQRSPFRQ